MKNFGNVLHEEVNQADMKASLPKKDRVKMINELEKIFKPFEGKKPPVVGRGYEQGFEFRLMSGRVVDAKVPKSEKTIIARVKKVFEKYGFTVKIWSTPAIKNIALIDGVLMKK